MFSFCCQRDTIIETYNSIRNLINILTLSTDDEKRTHEEKKLNVESDVSPSDIGRSVDGKVTNSIITKTRLWKTEKPSHQMYKLINHINYTES